MDHALTRPTELSVSPSLSASSDAASSPPWRTRLRTLFAVEFGNFDDLDLGSPEEFDTYVSTLFERPPSARS